MRLNNARKIIESKTLDGVKQPSEYYQTVLRFVTGG